MAANLDELQIKDEYLRRVLEGREFLLFDGAFGTMMQRAGLALGGECPDLLNLTAPEEITRIHRAYVDAGAQVSTTNTFGANALKLAGAASVEDVYRASVACARASGARYVAADIGPTGALLEPLGTLSFEGAYEVFAEQARAAQMAGADLIVIETMSDLLEAKAAVLAACDNASIPVFVTMTFGEDGRTFLGTTPAIAAVTLSSLGVAAVGVNCSLGPDDLVSLVAQMTPHARCPIMVQPNAGLPRVADGVTVYDVAPDQFADAMERVLDAGATIVGGCCGTDPRFIEALSGCLRQRRDSDMRMAASSYEGDFCVTSAQEAVVLPMGKRSIAVIGERINPTGKRRLRDALRMRDYDYVVAEAVAQRDAGAEILDVNVGLPDIDEPLALRAVVQTLQATITTPLQVDSSDPVAIEAAVRAYAGKPLVNSVSGKRASLEAVLPLVRRYGCCVVGLTLDDDGIPPTAEGRFAIAQRIVQAAEAMGIPRCDIAIDCLAMSAATNQREIVEVLRAVTLCKEHLGVRTVLGVSNVSFGLPHRSLVNATFLASALGAGLDLPILDPLSERYVDAVASFRVLNGQDEQARRFIDRYAATADPPAREAGAFAKAPAAKVIDSGTGSPAGVVASARGSKLPSNANAVNSDASLSAERLVGGLSDAFAPHADVVGELVAGVLDGRSALVAEIARQLLDSVDGMSLINEVLVPALDVVGERYERGDTFLPQLMSSAEAVRAGFEVVKAASTSSSASASGLGASISDDDPANTIVLATVEGDIHDIGKNIVKMLLENYGFRVIDLGRDVSPDEVVDAVVLSGARFAGLSALMTTTVDAMERTITLLHERVPACIVIVGGAVLNEEYARQIGADLYARDAASAASLLRSL